MLKCKCIVSPIARYINSEAFNSRNAIFLDQFADKLKCEEVLDKLNLCLDSHGFKGSVQLVDGHYIYLNEVVDGNTN